MADERSLPQDPVPLRELDSRLQFHPWIPVWDPIGPGWWDRVGIDKATATKLTAIRLEAHAVALEAQVTALQAQVSATRSAMKLLGR
jgi:hypothetical protein